MTCPSGTAPSWKTSWTAVKIGVPTERALDWCAAFAPMTALELAAAFPESPPDIDWLLAVTQAAT